MDQVTIPVIVVDAAPGAHLEARLEMALRLADEYDSSLTAVCAAWPASIAMSEIVAPVSPLAQEQALRDRVYEARQIFDRLTRHSTEKARWYGSVANPSIALGQQALLADLVITGVAGVMDLAVADPVALASQTGTPVLRVRRHGASETGRSRILVGWKDGRDARSALRAALPFLHSAERALLVGVGPEVQIECLREVEGYLGRHGLTVSTMAVDAEGRSPATVLNDIARDEGCNLVVAGARSQGRWKEKLFGGVTEEMLKANVTWLLAN